MTPGKAGIGNRICSSTFNDGGPLHVGCGALHSCVYCLTEGTALQALRNFQRLHVAVAAVGVLCLLALSSALGRGLAPLSPVPAATSAGIGSLPGYPLLEKVWNIMYNVERYEVCWMIQGLRLQVWGAGAVVCLAAWLGISHLLKRFHFIGYNHSEK